MLRNTGSGGMLYCGAGVPDVDCDCGEGSSAGPLLLDCGSATAGGIVVVGMGTVTGVLTSPATAG